MPRSQCYAEKRGDMWRGRYPDAGGRMLSTVRYPTKYKALKAARDARAAVEARPPADTVADTTDKTEKADMTLGEWFNEIWPGWDIELTTRANYSAHPPLHPAHIRRAPTQVDHPRGDRSLGAGPDQKRGYSPEYIGGARRRLHTILADALVAGHIAVNPATRQRGRGAKPTRTRARGSAEKVWAGENTALLLAERCALLGGEAEFVRVLLMAFTGLRWGEVTGLQASYVRAPDRRRNHHYIRVEWQLVELNGKFYLAPPKDGSRRDIDIPEWLSTWSVR